MSSEYQSTTTSAPPSKRTTAANTSGETPQYGSYAAGSAARSPSTAGGYAAQAAALSPPDDPTDGAVQMTVDPQQNGEWTEADYETYHAQEAERKARHPRPKDRKDWTADDWATYTAETEHKVESREDYESGQVFLFGEAKSGRRERAGDELTPDHIPSRAAVCAAIAARLGRELTPEEVEHITRNTVTIGSPHSIHADSSPTYGGRNDEGRIGGDAVDLEAAFQRDAAMWQAMVVTEGILSATDAATAVQEAYELNAQLGIFDPGETFGLGPAITREDLGKEERDGLASSTTTGQKRVETLVSSDGTRQVTENMSEETYSRDLAKGEVYAYEAKEAHLDQTDDGETVDGTGSASTESVRANVLDGTLARGASATDIVISGASGAPTRVDTTERAGQTVDVYGGAVIDAEAVEVVTEQGDVKVVEVDATEVRTGFTDKGLGRTKQASTMATTEVGGIATTTGVTDTGTAAVNVADGTGTIARDVKEVRNEGYGTGHVVEKGGSLTASAHGAEAEGKYGETVRDGAVTKSFVLSGTAVVDMDVKPVGSPPDCSYQSVFTISVGGKLQLGGGADTQQKPGETAKAYAGRMKGSGSLTGHVKGGASIVHRKTLTESQLADYELQLATWEETGEAPSLGEFSVLRRLDALAHANPAADVGAVLGSGDTARDMAQGESYEMTLSGGVGVGGEAEVSRGAYGGGVNASYETEWIRSVAIQRIAPAAPGEEPVFVSLTFTDKTKWEAGAKATAYAVTLGGGYHMAQEGTQVFNFRLNAAARQYDYDSVYGEIVGSFAPESADAIMGRLEPFGVSAGGSTMTSHREGGTGSIGLGNAKLEATAETFDSDALTTDGQGGATLEVTGGNSEGVAASVGDVKIDRTETEQLEATVEGGEVDARFEESASGTQIGGGSAPSLREAASQAPRDTARKWVLNPYKEVEQAYQLNDGDFETVVARARNPAGWDPCCVSLSTMPAWKLLRQQLGSPTLREEWADADPVTQMKMGQVTHFRDFMKTRGSMDCVRRVLREYTTRSAATGAVIHHADTADLEQWPRSVSKHEAGYKGLRERVGAVSDTLDAYQSAQDGQSKAVVLCNRLHADLRAMDEILNGAEGDFTNKRAFIEMLAKLDEWTVDVREEREEFTTEWDATHNPVGVEAEPPTSSTVYEGKPEMVVAKEQSLTRLAQQEHQIFQLLDRHFYGDKSGTAYAKARFWYSHTEVQDSYTQIAQLYELWKADILELRSLYTANGVPREEWVVSTGPGATRNWDNEPNVHMYIYMMKREAEEESDFIDTRAIMGNDDGTIHPSNQARWIRRYEDY